MSSTFAIGERVIASVWGTGKPRAGTVTTIIGGAVSRYLWNDEARYMVHFDRDHGHSGPCVVLRAEGGREAEPSTDGTGA